MGKKTIVMSHIENEISLKQKKIYRKCAGGDAKTFKVKEVMLRGRERERERGGGGGGGGGLLGLELR